MGIIIGFCIALTILLFCVIFLLVGALRALTITNWRINFLEATSARRPGSVGMKVGRQGPDFGVLTFQGNTLDLQQLRGRRVLLVFLHIGGVGFRPSDAIVSDLNRLHKKGDVHVVAIQDGEPDEVRNWAAAWGVRFPLCIQQQQLCHLYKMHFAPYAFLINERGFITAKGIVYNTNQIDLVIK